MKHHILIIDDYWKRRKDNYLKLKNAISERYSAIEVEVDFLETHHDLEYLLRNKKYDAVILDAVLSENNGWEDFNISKALKYLGNNIPIAIISSQWDQTNSDEIAEAWKQPNCRTFLHWRDIEETPDGQIVFAVTAIVSILTDPKQLNLTTKLEPNESIRIVHISDIQFGGFDEKNIDLEMGAVANVIEKYWKGEKPIFVILTGDVAEYGAPSQYHSALKWLKKLFNKLKMGNLPSPNFLYVPGNHDVNLCLAASPRISITNDPESNEVIMMLDDEVIEDQKELLDHAYTPFREFINKVCGNNFPEYNLIDQSLDWVNPQFRHLGVLFYGVNTAQPANCFTLPSRKVNSKRLDDIQESLNKYSDGFDTPPLVIGMGHHNPISAIDDEGVENPESFEIFFGRKIRTALFLHGHTHEHLLKYESQHQWRLVRSCAPSLSKPEKNRKKDTDRGFNLHELVRNNHIVTDLISTSFGWDSSVLIQKETKKFKRNKTDGMFHENHDE